jgi:hypothetical protein
MISIILSILALNVSHAAYCNGRPHKDAKPNLNPIYTGTPVFVRKYEDGAGNEA